jgi:exopolysaccharide production protein ExoY
MAAPIFAIASVAILLESPGPVLFGHLRVGKDGREFRCWKLRTMVVDADARLDSDPELRDKFATNYKLIGDPRVTLVGRVLRRFSIDEIPQFWNVVRGDMGLVGPRPVTREELVEMYGGHAEVVTSVRPGITGLWQISGRSNLSYEDRVRLDLNYVRSKSVLLDFAIIARTPAALIRSRGAV